MAAKQRKVVLFIVEGYTEEDALSAVMKRVFQTREVVFHVVRGDITVCGRQAKSSAIQRIAECITAEMNRYRFTKDDILQIIHLVDTDGAFIPDRDVEQSESVPIVYTREKILALDRNGIVARNQRKRAALIALSATDRVSSIPYAVYYLSRNLEHVLFGVEETLDSEQKVDYADTFTEQYGTRPEEFIRFMAESDFAVHGDYSATWAYIAEGWNSLHRHSNLHLALPKPEP